MSLMLVFPFFSPQIAVTLLVHKIHSPQEWEALQALTVRKPATEKASILETIIYFKLLCPGIGGMYEELWEEVS